MKHYILIAFMIFFILIKTCAIFKISKGEYSSKIVRYWTIVPFNLDRITEFTKKKQKEINYLIYLSTILDIMFAIITILIIPEAGVGVILTIGILLYLNPVIFSNYINNKYY